MRERVCHTHAARSSTREAHSRRLSALVPASVRCIRGHAWGKWYSAWRSCVIASAMSKAADQDDHRRYVPANGRVSCVRPDFAVER
jgi:hypothetical protein